MSGTSFAAPRVAGVLGELLRRVTPAEAVTVLRQSARPMENSRYGEGKLGAGLLARHTALSIAEPGYWFRHWAWLFVLIAGVCFAHAQGSLDVRFKGTAYLSLFAWCLATVVWFYCVRVFCLTRSVVGADVLAGVGLASFFVVPGLAAWGASHVGAWVEVRVAARRARAVARSGDVQRMRALVRYWTPGLFRVIDPCCTEAVVACSRREPSLLSGWLDTLGKKGYATDHVPPEMESRLGVLRVQLLKRRGLGALQTWASRLLELQAETREDINALAEEAADFTASHDRYREQQRRAAGAPVPVSEISEELDGLATAARATEAAAEGLRGIKDATDDVSEWVRAQHARSGELESLLNSLADVASQGADALHRVAQCVRTVESGLAELVERAASLDQAQAGARGLDGDQGEVGEGDARPPTEDECAREWASLVRQARGIGSEAGPIAYRWRRPLETVRGVLGECKSQIIDADSLRVADDYWSQVGEHQASEMTHTARTLAQMAAPLLLFVIGPIWAVLKAAFTRPKRARSGRR